MKSYRRDPGVKDIQNGCPDVWVLRQGMGVEGVPSPSSGEPQGLPPSLGDCPGVTCVNHSLPQDCVCFSAMQHHLADLAATVPFNAWGLLSLDLENRSWVSFRALLSIWKIRSSDHFFPSFFSPLCVSSLNPFPWSEPSNTPLWLYREAVPPTDWV